VKKQTCTRTKSSAAEGPSTTAETLLRDRYADKFPEDPQVREDFGFTRCRNGMEESHLFGMYQGIFKALEVTATEMHKMATEERPEPTHSIRCIRIDADLSWQKLQGS
jgi:hypothetical protein